MASYWNRIANFSILRVFGMTRWNFVKIFGVRKLSCASTDGAVEVCTWIESYGSKSCSEARREREDRRTSRDQRHDEVIYTKAAGCICALSFSLSSPDFDYTQQTDQHRIYKCKGGGCSIQMRDRNPRPLLSFSFTFRCLAEPLYWFRRDSDVGKYPEEPGKIAFQTMRTRKFMGFFFGGIV